MESSRIFLAILATLLAASVQTAYAISCYECNSHWKYDGKACKDPIDTSVIKPIDCNEEYNQAGSFYPGNYTMCRKMHQEVEGDSRIFRSCAIDGDDKCIDRTGTKGISVKYCECYGDFCNLAPGATAASLITASVLCIIAVTLRL